VAFIRTIQPKEVDEVPVVHAEALQEGVLHDWVVLVVPVQQLARDRVEHSRLVEQVLVGKPAELVGRGTVPGHGANLL
jgi:hypothetical protein